MSAQTDDPLGLYMLREWREGQMPLLLAAYERPSGGETSLDLMYVWFGEDDIVPASDYNTRANARTELEDPDSLRALLATGELVRLGDYPNPIG